MRISRVEGDSQSADELAMQSGIGVRQRPDDAEHSDWASRFRRIPAPALASVETAGRNGGSAVLEGKAILPGSSRTSVNFADDLSASRTLLDREPVHRSWLSEKRRGHRLALTSRGTRLE